MFKIPLLLFVLLCHKLYAQIHYDTLLTETARFIAGIDCETDEFKFLQQKAWYKEHAEFTHKTWKYINDSTLLPINLWAGERNIIEKTDTLTCFYPFSGPDFLFSHVFYPYAKSYILLGLERLGSLPQITKLNQNQLENYLLSIRSSLRYLVKAGYFVTSHMSRDFSKAQLNGNIHLLMYFIVRSGYFIKTVKYGNIDKNGIFKLPKNTGTIEGLHILFVDSLNRNKDLYYFSLDVADYKLSNKPEFEKFIKSFATYNTYIKSASYIPAHKNFETIRKLILNHSNKIIQDDTGIPYKLFESHHFALQIWGTYTKTINDLSWGFQPDLKKAVEASENNKPLPFRISYNGNYGEGVMMYGKKKQ